MVKKSEMLLIASQGLNSKKQHQGSANLRLCQAACYMGIYLSGSIPSQITQWTSMLALQALLKRTSLHEKTASLYLQQIFYSIP
jgi:hypothetical protein